MDPLHMHGFWLQQMKKSMLEILQRQDNYVHQYVETLTVQEEILAKIYIRKYIVS